MKTYIIKYAASWVRKVSNGFTTKVKANSRMEAQKEFEKYFPLATIISIREIK